jgi:hypothetical protein
MLDDDELMLNASLAANAESGVLSLVARVAADPDSRDERKAEPVRDASLVAVLFDWFPSSREETKARSVRMEDPSGPDVTIARRLPIAVVACEPNMGTALVAAGSLSARSVSVSVGTAGSTAWLLWLDSDKAEMAAAVAALGVGVGVGVVVVVLSVSSSLRAAIGTLNRNSLGEDDETLPGEGVHDADSGLGCREPDAAVARKRLLTSGLPAERNEGVAARDMVALEVVVVTVVGDVMLSLLLVGSESAALRGVGVGKESEKGARVRMAGVSAIEPLQCE